MPWRRWLIPLLAALVLAPAAAAQAPPGPTPPTPAPPPEPRIAPGVHAASQDLSNLTVAEATAKLKQSAGRRLRANLYLRVAGRRFGLRMRRIRFRFDARRTARRAYRSGLKLRPGQTREVRIFVKYRRDTLLAFVKRVARAVYGPPRDAQLRITLRRMIRTRSRPGRRLLEHRVRAKLWKVLRNPKATRLIKPRRFKVRAAIRWKDLPRRYPTVATIDRSGFRLRLFKRLRYDRSYPVAVGLPGYDTPAGLFSIISKQVNPVWTAPNAPWAGELAGSSVPGGSDSNPLRARWLGIVGGVGVHGTSEDWSIGTRASHGCIRMRVWDVTDLYDRVPLGAPVLIG